MRKSIVLFFLLLVYSVVKGQNETYWTYPSLETLKEKFFSSYKNPENVRIDIMKKKEGIYVVEYTTSYPYDSLTSKLFWSKKHKTYQKLPYQKNENKKTEGESFLFQNDNYAFDHNLYYGYLHWYNDVIKELDGQKGLREKDLYALGRAYSSKAMHHLGHEYGERGGYQIINPVHINNEYILSGISNAYKAIETFYKVYQLNPLYETRVGNIYDKYSNEYMCFYYVMEMNDLKQHAGQFLKKDLYTPEYLSYARNILNNCEDNSILFTGGDGDTYPLLYLQEMEGLKKSVKIINTSLLNGRYYTDYIFKTSSLKTSVSSEMYSTALMDYMYVNKENDSIAAFSVMMKDIKNSGGDVVKTYEAGAETHFYLEGSNITNQSRIFDFSDREFLYKSDLFILDVINNEQNSNIYFCSSLTESDYRAYKKYLEEDFMVYKYTGIANEKGNEIRYATASAYKFYLEKFKFETGDSTIKYFEDGIIRIVYSYRKGLARLADQLTKEGKKDEARAALNKAFILFPYKIYPPDYYSPVLSSVYFKTGDDQKAESYMDACYQYALNYFESNEEYSAKKYPSEISLNLAALDQLSNAAKENNKTALGEKYYNSLLKYYNLYFIK